MSTQTFIVAAKRTAFGAFGGSLRRISATELGGIAAKAALSALPPTLQQKSASGAGGVDAVIFGNVLQSSTCAPYLARHVGLRAGLSVEVPALTVNRLCGSGFQSVVNAVQEIRCGDAQIVLAGGAENMSQAPFAARDVRWGVKFGPEYLKLEDTLSAALTDRYPVTDPMGITAERLAAKYGVSRQDADEYALRSQQRYASALERGEFADEITGVPVAGKKRGMPETLFDRDEHPRLGTTIEALSKLPPVFQKNGVVTAGNASGISDGAAALVVASEAACAKHNLSKLARIAGYKVVGVEPGIMGIGPVGAIRGALAMAGKQLSDMELVEVNEAFSAQYLSVERELELSPVITNACGGAIALGHPLGASGARILTHLVHQMQRHNKHWAVGAACIGGGQGIAVVLENTQL